LLTASSLPAAEIVVPVPECSPVFETGQTITAPGYTPGTSPGDPALPFKDLFLLLPPDADPRSITVMLRDTVDSPMEGQHEIAPAPPITTVVDGKEVQDWGPGKKIANGRNMLVYGRDEYYPRANVELMDAGSLRSWRLARVRYYPLRYNPVSRRLVLSTGGEIVLSCRTISVVAGSASSQTDGVFSDLVAGLASNYSEARGWYPVPSRPTRLTAESSPGAITDYVVLTTSAIAAGSAKLQAFLNHKATRGFSTALVTESQWGGGTGDVAAERIRAYLKANYLNKGIKYVLLIGNPHPTSGDVPMKMLWPRRSSTTYREAPSDYYYADLTGNWDLDRDGYYGEGDHDLKAGGVDRYPEVIVGRIPFYGNFADLDSVLQKTIDYEAGGIGGPWVNNVLLTMKPSDTYTPGYHLGEAIKSAAAAPAGFGVTRVYEETYGLNPPPNSTPCNYTTSLNAAQQHSGFWFWWTHGSETVAADVMSSDRTQYLDDRYPAFTFQCSCLNGAPENPNNLGYALLRRGAIATDAASRVSWYYPGQTDFSNTDSNAGMTYRYAIKLVRDHKPCGDAHFEMMVETPLDIWMNHCVFNLYGDPSVAYAAGPTVSHTPHRDTDVTSSPYVLDAQITTNGPIKSGSPTIRWNTNGGGSFTSAPMSLVSGNSYRGQIPGQPYGTTVYYYIHVEDVQGRIALSPSSAPNALHSFKVRTDSQPPVIQHTPPGNTGELAGPYPVRATVTDNTGVQSVTLYYHRNSGADSPLPMQPIGGNQYEALIPGPSSAGDVISYYIVATDVALGRNSSREPSPSGYHSFAVPPKKQVAVLNCATVPPYFLGSNSNAYQAIKSILDTDPAQRFQVNIITSLTATNLSGQDALVLPDNAVPSEDMATVSNWFVQGKTILTLESGTSYAACSGFLWPQAAGTNGYGTYWDTSANQNDQEIVLQDQLTAGYTLGQVIDSRGYTAAFIASALPQDARILSRSQFTPTRAYAVYRDVPGKGRFVALGPFIPLQQSQYSLIREALAVTPGERTIKVTGPAAGSVFDAGQTVRITFQTSGNWLSSDKVRIEYTTGLDGLWRSVPGASALGYATGAFDWNTAGLVGSRGYRIRVSHVGGSATGTSASTFTIVPVVDIVQAKSVPDGQLVKLAGKTVTSALAGLSYVQEPNRLAGIRVQSSQPLAESTSATIVGTMVTINGERALQAESVQVIASSARVNPMFLRTDALGGSVLGGQQGVYEYRRIRSGTAWSVALQPAVGLNNIGLLVKVAGTVTATGSGFFYIDDGARCSDGSGYTGVKVLSGSFTRPALGSRVTLTAISSSYYDRGQLWRALVMPTQDSVRVIP
jgi:hypothetical protein